MALSACALNNFYRVYPEIVMSTRPTQGDLLDIQKKYEHLTLLDRAVAAAKELLEVVDILRAEV
jgi:hypothetical protein